MNKVQASNGGIWFSVFVICTPACDRPTEPAGSTASTGSAPQPKGSAELAPPRPEPAPPGASSVPSTVPSANTGTATTVNFDSDSLGGPSRSFEGVVGDWYVADVAGARGLMVDGSKWRNGTPSASLADQAKRLYGERYAQFLDGVKAFAFFPFAVWQSDPPPGDLRISVRFYPVAGKIDQGAGIAFGISSNGTYFGIRANALENNLLYFRVVKGRRTIIDDIRNVPTPTKSWHTLAIELRGTDISAEVDGQKRFQKTLDAVPLGRVGLWSKADSQVLFDDFTVERLAGR